MAWPQWAAVAASLALGVLAGRELWSERGPLATRGGEMVARGDLDKALTTQLASDGGAVTVGLTFRAGDGRYCRTFQSPAARLAGLACRLAAVDAMNAGGTLDAAAERAARDAGWKP
jgi:hypothetical protein